MTDDYLPSRGAAVGSAPVLPDPSGPPPGARCFRAERRVRLADVDPGGRARLDALARYLQDVAADDVRDGGADEIVVWVVRQTTIVAPRRPRYGEVLQLATWCSGTGAAWAQRRTTVGGEQGPAVEAVSLWVSLDPGQLRPMAVPAEIAARWGPPAQARRVPSRLLLPASPPEGTGVARPWPLRRADFDVLGHLNNAASWVPLEDEARRILVEELPAWGRVEYRFPVGEGTTLSLASSVSSDDGAVVSVWLVAGDGGVVTSARLGGSGV
ncbi:MAG: acyl-[acyl-carrier-protein] thioesterase [Acidimicrobiales bacterium]